MEIRIDKDFDGKTVKDFLYKNGISRGAIVRLKKLDKGIILNGERVTVRKILKFGDRLELMTEDTNEDENSYLIPEKSELDILYEDKELIAVNKPPLVPTHPSLGYPTATVANSVAYYFTSQGIPFVFRAISRLDRDTSGVLLIAKNRISAARLCGLMKEGKIKKTYLALLNGRIAPAFGEICRPIRRKPDSIMLREVCEESAVDAKKAVTRYKTIFSANGISAVKAEPVTGRTHQLRVHFSSIGYPIIGDGLYGNVEKNPTHFDKKINRQALHALSLSIDFGDRRLDIFTPPPEDMMNLLGDTDVLEKLKV